MRVVQPAFVLVLALSVAKVSAAGSVNDVGNKPGAKNASGAGTNATDAVLESLYRAHRWFDLRKALLQTNGTLALYRGAVAGAFHQRTEAERILRPLTQSVPRSEPGYEAYEILAHLYIQAGQYSRLKADLNERLVTFPDKEELKRDQNALGPLLDLPDQEVDQLRFSVVRHDGGLFVPVSIQGQDANYFIDTGAAISCLSVSEARRLGLAIRDAPGDIGTSTTRKTQFRTAVATNFSLGDIRLRNVSFAVFRDDQEPWMHLPPGRRGLLGHPVLLACRTLRWSRDGTVELGPRTSNRDSGKPNLCFDDDHLMLMAGFRDRELLFALDCGAVNTDLYATFATEFTALLEKSGRKETKELRGIGQVERLESVALPELTFRIGGVNTVLRPAHVLLKQIGSPRAFGNLGMDLLNQEHAFNLDFQVMTLALEPAR